MRFVTFDQAASHIRGRRAVLLGSAPSVLDNEPGFIDAHDVVIRVNNHKTGERQGHRTDVYYSFFGNSIRKTPQQLQAEGVRLCMCKCPNSQPIDSEWHRARGKLAGIDFRYIYELRAAWWFCDTYIPTDDAFVKNMDVVVGHIPTTGFSALLDVLACEPRSLHLTGFDFFSSGVHNVDERWRPGDPTDPIGHRPDLEAAWIKRNAGGFPITWDRKLREMLG